MRRAFLILFFAPMLVLVGCGTTRGTGSKSAAKSGVANPLYPFTLLRQGSVQLQQGHYEAALKSFKEAAQLQPGNATAHNMVGLCYLRLKKFDQALQAFDRALVIIPSFSDARNNRGVAYLALKQYRQAEVDFLAVLSDTTYPHRWDVYYNLGMTYLQRDQLVAAEENFRKAAKAPVPVFRAFLRLADVEQRQGNMDGAIETLQDAHLKFPDRPRATLELGRALIRNGQKDEARKYLEQLISSDPGSKLADEAQHLLQGS